MQLEPINLTSIIATIMGISIVLIPVIGLTARFALKPVVEALARAFEGRGNSETFQIMERRLGLMEAQIDSMENTIHRLEEGSGFDAQLRSGGDTSTGQLPKP